MSTRTSSRQAAQKAKEAISETNGKPTGGAKRKVTTKEAPAAKRGKKADVAEPKEEKAAEPEPKEEKAAEQEVKPEVAEEAPKVEEKPPAPAAEGNIHPT